MRMGTILQPFTGRALDERQHNAASGRVALASAKQFVKSMTNLAERVRFLPPEATKVAFTTTAALPSFARPG